MAGKGEPKRPRRASPSGGSLGEAAACHSQRGVVSRPAKAASLGTEPPPSASLAQANKTIAQAAADMAKLIGSHSISKAAASALQALEMARSMTVSPEQRAYLEGPEFQGWLRLSEVLKGALEDPIIAGSKEAHDLLELFREVAAARDGLRQLYKAMSQHGGGRPRNDERNAQWAARYEELCRTHPHWGAQDRYEKIARDWEAAGHKLLTWRGVQNEISKWNRKKIRR